MIKNEINNEKLVYNENMFLNYKIWKLNEKESKNNI